MALPAKALAVLLDELLLAYGILLDRPLARTLVVAALVSLPSSYCATFGAIAHPFNKGAKVRV